MEAVTSYTQSGKVKKSVPIFTGVFDIGKGTSTTASYDTNNPKSLSFRDVKPSVNQSSGTELSYNFWLYKDDEVFTQVTSSNESQTTDAELSPNDFILFVHGDRKAIRYNNVCGVARKNIMVKCPLVKLERGGKVLTVEVNTMASPDAVRVGSANICRESNKDWFAMNNHKLGIYIDDMNDSTALNKRWFMITIVLKDTSPELSLPRRNKAVCRIYINGVLQMEQMIDDRIGSAISSTTQSVLRPNTGGIHIAPRVEIDNTRKTNTMDSTINESDKLNRLLMADLTYYNYAVREAEIKTMYANGFTKDWAAAPGTQDESVKGDIFGSDSTNNNSEKIPFKIIGA